MGILSNLLEAVEGQIELTHCFWENLHCLRGMQCGRQLVGAGYCLYGSSCSTVLSVGKQPAHFTLDPSLGEFVLTTARMSIPESGKIYSINEGNSILWDKAVSR